MFTPSARCTQRYGVTYSHPRLFVKWAPVDMDMALDTIVPESLNWKHTDEGPE